MRNHLPEVLAVILLILAVLGLIHQHLISNDSWFSFYQLKNHETIVACCIVGAIALITGKYLGRDRF